MNTSKGIPNFTAVFPLKMNLCMIWQVNMKQFGEIFRSKLFTKCLLGTKYFGSTMFATMSEAPGSLCSIHKFRFAMMYSAPQNIVRTLNTVQRMNWCTIFPPSKFFRHFRRFVSVESLQYFSFSNIIRSQIAHFLVVCVGFLVGFTALETLSAVSDITAKSSFPNKWRLYSQFGHQGNPCIVYDNHKSRLCCPGIEALSSKVRQTFWNKKNRMWLCYINDKKKKVSSQDFRKYPIRRQICDVALVCFHGSHFTIP